MVKKLAAICLVTMLSLIMVPFAASAEQAVILSPENGAVVSPSFSEIAVALPSGTDKAVLYLDGERVLETTEGAISYTLEKPLAIGKHEAAVVTISESGAEMTVSAFEVKTSIVNVHISTDMPQAPEIPEFSKGSAAVTDASGESHEIQFKKVSGREGGEDKAIAFYCPVEALPPVPFANVNASYTTKSGVLGFPWTGNLDFQMDLYFSHPMNFGFETKNTAGKFCSFFDPNLFTPNGTITLSGGYEYPIDEWFRIRVLINMDTLISSLDIGTYEEDGSITWERVIADYLHNDKIRNTNILKIQPNYKDGAPAGQTIAFDNLVITEEKIISADVKMSYADESGDLIVAEGNICPAGTAVINAQAGTAFDIKDAEEGNATDKVTVFADGTKIPLTSATLDEDGLTAYLSVPIPAGAQCKMVLSGDTLLGTGDKLGTDVSYSFKTAYENSAVGAVAFSVNSKPLYSVVQLSEGDTLEATVEHPAAYGKESAVYCLAVYDGTELVAMKCVVSDVTAMPRSLISLTLPQGFTLSDETEIKLFTADSLSGRVPASAVYSLK